jgi:hypothetical protein
MIPKDPAPHISTPPNSGEDWLISRRDGQPIQDNGATRVRRGPCKSAREVWERFFSREPFSAFRIEVVK